MRERDGGGRWFSPLSLSLPRRHLAGGDAGGALGSGGEKDALLLLGLFTLVLVGSLAQDLAGDTWDKVQKEVKADAAARAADPAASLDADAAAGEGFAALLPFNVTAVTQGALNLVPQVKRTDPKPHARRKDEQGERKN